MQNDLADAVRRRLGFAPSLNRANLAEIVDAILASPAELKAVIEKTQAAPVPVDTVISEPVPLPTPLSGVERHALEQKLKMAKISNKERILIQAITACKTEKTPVQPNTTATFAERKVERIKAAAKELSQSTQPRRSHEEKITARLARKAANANRIGSLTGRDRVLALATVQMAEDQFPNRRPAPMMRGLQFLAAAQ
jgi:hypothetical protein